MATITAPPEEETEVVEVVTTKTPKGKKTKTKKVKKKNGKVSSIEVVQTKTKKAGVKVKRAAKKSWKKFRAGLSKMRQRLIRMFGWAKRSAKKAWLKSLKATRTARAKVVQAARSSSAWVKSAAIGAWEFTAPFRTWISTPFRLAFGTTAGLATLLIFGGKVILLLTLPWIAYLLVSGRMVMTKKGKKRVKAKKSPKKAKPVYTKADVLDLDEESSVTVQAAKDTRILNQAQMDAIAARMNDLRRREEAAADKDDKNLASDLAGRLYLVERRLFGSTESVNQLARLHRQNAEETLGIEMANEVHTWTAVKRGMTAEDKTIEALVDHHADESQLTH